MKERTLYISLDPLALLFYNVPSASSSGDRNSASHAGLLRCLICSATT